MRTINRFAVLTSIALAFIASVRADEKCDAEKKAVDKHLAAFDDLDFNRFSKAKDLPGFNHSHTQDVLVHWPDGHTTKGLKKHLEDMEYMFSYAPDTRIPEHPIKVGQGEWTAVHGIMEGTFTKPMKMPDGKIIQPTGKKFKIAMATFSHWNKDGLFDEEYLFWDNQTYMSQLGLGK
jgi:hypothetical protein